MKCRVRPGLGLWQVSRGRERGVKELRAMMATPTKAKLAKEGGGSEAVLMTVMTTEVIAEMEKKTLTGEVEGAGGPGDGEIIRVDGEVTQMVTGAGRTERG